MGYKLGARDGEIGRVRDIYFDDQKWAMRYLVADTGRWLPRRKVLISPHALGEIHATEKVIDVDLLKERIKDCPSIDEDEPVSREYERKYYGHYGWPMYWGGPLVWGNAPYPAAYPGIYPIRQDPEQTHEDTGAENHLRSLAEVSTYRIQARDGEIGHVQDLLLDPREWTVRYLMVDTSALWSGKKVLVAPEWVTGIDWEKRHVTVDLGRDSVKQAPAFDPDHAIISRDYEERLHTHYEKDPYWKRPMEPVASH
jgi:hypothetical protein